MLQGPLYGLTAVTNFVCLAVSLWLGFYIVTRSPRSKVSWLASATLWSLSGYFLNHLTYVQGPAVKGVVPWWWGWSVAFAAPCWFHLSVCLLPARLARRQRPLVLFMYLLTLNFVAIEAYTPWVFAGETMRPAIYNSAQRPGPLYPLFGLYLVAAPAFSLFNLGTGRRQATSPLIRRQLATLQWAASLAVLGAIYTTVSTWFGLDTPTALSSLSLGTGVALLGYAVARYNALVEGRAIRLDFVYTSLAIGLVIAAYLLAAVISDAVFGVPFIAFIFVIVLAVVSHSLYDWARTFLDRIFYRRQHRELRANLRDLVHRITPDRDIQESLQAILHTLCRSLEVSRGYIALREADSYNVVANWRVGLQGRSVASEALAADEIARLSPPLKYPELADMALTVPLHAAGEQIGAIVLGQRTTGGTYADEDLDVLEDCADAVASVVQSIRSQEQSVQQIDFLLRAIREQEQEVRGRMRQALVAEARSVTLEGHSEKDTVSLVDDALRHLHDFPHLGEHRLARLGIIESRLDVEEGAFVTHLDRGRALRAVLIAAIGKLKPPGSQPSPATRQWRQYLILHDAYVLGELNRDIMAKLYIGEGTFNRARRRAIRAVARALGEMERQVQERSPM